jgi:4-amino-4-deoxy-L-arabinose transferase-like glycosyltransferase
VRVAKYGVVVILLASAALRFLNLAALGYADHYYTAGVTAMLRGPSNFFYLAAEPGGSISIDKPPVGLWLQAVSAALIGVNGPGVLFPQLAAGILSVALVFALVRRWFGGNAGLIAATVMALSPVSIAVDRNNTIDSTLIFTLLLAAWAFVKATGSDRLPWLLLGAVLVGVAFNVKMLEAYLPLPAFFALYLFTGAGRWYGRIAKLALASLVLLTVSFSWAVAVDLTPRDERPYIGSSQDNSMLNLILWHNGLERVFGTDSDGGILTEFLHLTPPVVNDGASTGGAERGDAIEGARRPPGPEIQPAVSNGPALPRSGVGDPGPFRLITPPLSKEVSWLLPFALVGFAVLLLRSWHSRERFQAAVLWGGWLLVAGAFFSVAGFFHEYYVALLAPPIAALTGAGFVDLWRIRVRHWLVPALLVSAGAVLTFWLQWETVKAFGYEQIWLQAVLALLTAAVFVFLTSLFVRGDPGAAAVGYGGLLATLLLAPGIWSAYTTAYPSVNQSIPNSYVGRPSGPGALAGLTVNPTLLNLLEGGTGTYLLAVPNSMQGADYVIATGRPVLYIGGYLGDDPVADVEQLQKLVESGQLRYVYWSSRGRNFGAAVSEPPISAWTSRACRAVPGYDTTTENAGAPDGTGSGSSSSESFRISLYDCAPRQALAPLNK